MSVVNVKVSCIRPDYDDLKQWMEDDKNVYIGRKGIIFVKNEEGKKERFPKEDSIWANPFKVDEDGTREEVIKQYKKYIKKKLTKDKALLEELGNLRGKTLGCWCKPDPCHGDVLVEMIQKFFPEKESKEETIEPSPKRMTPKPRIKFPKKEEDLIPVMTNEETELYKQRAKITKMIQQKLNTSKDNSIMLGFMFVNRVRYGISYTADMERLLDYIEEIL